MVFQYICILCSGVLICCCCSIRNSVNNRVRVNKNEIDHGIAFSKLQEVIETYEKEDDNEVICPITQDLILEGETVKKLPCGHEFSIDINKWICEKNCCPVCRENIVKLVK